MLVYVATYPRSGNSWLRQMLGLNWRYLTTPDAGDWNTFKAAAASYNILDHTGFFSSYAHSSSAARRIMYRGGEITPGLRETLASSPERFFIKTHGAPPDVPFEGESAIQMVRHPLDVYASWAEFEQRFGADPLAAEDLISGAHYGTWADYHSRWEASSIALWRTKFEDATRDERAVISSLGDFLGLPRIAPRTNTIAAFRARTPARYPAGHPDRWRSTLSAECVSMASEINFAAAAAIGYSMPPYPRKERPAPACATRHSERQAEHTDFPPRPNEEPQFVARSAHR